MLSNVDYKEKTYATHKRAGVMLEAIIVNMPKHPVLPHYIIHCCDYPALADRAVEAVHRYLDIATSMPRTLHMYG